MQARKGRLCGTQAGGRGGGPIDGVLYMLHMLRAVSVQLCIGQIMKLGK